MEACVYGLMSIDVVLYRFRLVLSLVTLFLQRNNFDLSRYISQYVYVESTGDNRASYQTYQGHLSFCVNRELAQIQLLVCCYDNNSLRQYDALYGNVC